MPQHKRTAIPYPKKRDIDKIWQHDLYEANNSRKRVKTSTILHTPIKRYPQQDEQKNQDISSIRQILTILRNADKKRLSEATLHDLDTLLKTISHSFLTSKQLAKIVYSLKHNTSKDTTAYPLLKTLAEKISRSKSSFNNKDLTECLAGITNLDHLRYELREFFAVLATKIKDMTEHLDAQSITLSVASLGRLIKIQNTSAKSFLTRLADKIAMSTARLNDDQTAEALYQLKEVKKTSPEFRYLLSTLPEKIMLTPFTNILDIMKCFRGLQHMSSRDTEVTNLLRTLRKKLENSTCTPDATCISGTFFGLQHMDNADREVRKLLPVLTQNLANSAITFNSQSVGNGLCIFKNMTDSPETLALISQVTDSILNTSDLQLETEHLAMGIFSLQYMTDTAQTQRLIQVLREKNSTWPTPEETAQILIGLANKPTQIAWINTLLKNLRLDHCSGRSLQRLAEAISRIRYYGHKTPLSSNANNSILAIHRRFIRVRQQQKPSWFESNVLQLLQQSRAAKYLDIQSGHPHISGYEMDFYLEDIQLNIELDDSSHHANYKKDTLRDLILMKLYGITTERISEKSEEDAKNKILALYRKYL
jgi:very-short-patch-repair endonuclease